MGNGEKGKGCFLVRITDVQFIHLYILIHYMHKDTHTHTHISLCILIHKHKDVQKRQIGAI